MAFELDPDEEMGPKVIDFATSSTEGDGNKETTEQNLGEETEERVLQNPGAKAVPIIAITKSEIESKTPTLSPRVMQRVKFPTRRYGTDYVQLDSESDK